MYILAIIGGILTTLSMVINSTLAKKVGLIQSTLINYIVGLIFSIFTLLVIGSSVQISIAQLKSTPIFMFLGGLIGVSVVYTSNIIIPRIPIFYSMILLFIGQVITGIIIDFIICGNIEINKIIGSIIVTLGIIYNSKIDKNLNNSDSE